MKTEAAAIRIHPEIKPNASIVVDNVIYPDFLRRQKRNGIIGISGAIANPKPGIEQKRGENVIDFPSITKPEFPIEEEVKKYTYNPGKRKKEHLDDGRRIIRIKRRSRCDGVHDPEEKPCGSPRCRTKNRVKLNTNKTAHKEKNTAVRSKNRRTRTLIIGR